VGVIEATCGSCGKKLRVRDEHAGKRAKCPGCGVVVEVPAAAVFLPIDAGEPSREPASGPPPTTPLKAVPAAFAALAFAAAACAAGFLAGRATAPAPGAPPAAPPSWERPAEPGSEVAAGESHLLDKNHPDFGGIVLLTLLKRSTARVVPGRGLAPWFASLPPHEREARVMAKLCWCVSNGTVEGLVGEGYGDEIPALILTLDEIGTPSSRSAADALRRLALFVKPGSKPHGVGADDGGGTPWDGSREERVELVRQLNEELEPLNKSLQKDVDHYFYRKWKREGEAFWE
jgi:hypothetical protein